MGYRWATDGQLGTVPSRSPIRSHPMKPRSYIAPTYRRCPPLNLARTWLGPAVDWPSTPSHRVRSSDLIGATHPPPPRPDLRRSREPDNPQERRRLGRARGGTGARPRHRVRRRDGGRSRRPPQPEAQRRLVPRGAIARVGGRATGAGADAKSDHHRPHFAHDSRRRVQGTMRLLARCRGGMRGPCGGHAGACARMHTACAYGMCMWHVHMACGACGMCMWRMHSTCCT